MFKNTFLESRSTACACIVRCSRSLPRCTKNAIALPIKVTTVAMIPKFLINESHITHLPSPHPFFVTLLFFLTVCFLCTTACCAFSCAFTKVGAFSYGLELCTISFRFNVTSFAANGCVRGIPYLARYDRPSNPCSLRCLTDSCLKLAPHSRHVTVYLVILFFQWTGSGGVADVAPATLPFASSWT